MYLAACLPSTAPLAPFLHVRRPEQEAVAGHPASRLFGSRCIRTQTRCRLLVPERHGPRQILSVRAAKAGQGRHMPQNQPAFDRRPSFSYHLSRTVAQHRTHSNTASIFAGPLAGMLFERNIYLRSRLEQETQESRKADKPS